MRAYLDPESGVIGGMPAPEQIEGVHAVPQLREEILPDGSVMLDLQGTGQEYMILHVDARGGHVVRCVQDPKAALVSPTPPPKPEVK